MKNKNILLIFPIMFLCLISSGYAITVLSNYNLTNTTGVKSFDALGAYQLNSSDSNVWRPNFGKIGGSIYPNATLGSGLVYTNQTGIYSRVVGVSFWLYRTGNFDTNAHIISCGGSNANGGWAIITNGTTGVQPYVNRGWSSIAGEATLNTWTHFAMVITDTGHIRVYRNGAYVSSGSGSALIVGTGYPCTIGYRYVDNRPMPNLYIDEVSFLSGATDADIMAIYLNESAGNPYPWLEPPQINFSITAINSVNGSLINNIYANLTNGTTYDYFTSGTQIDTVIPAKGELYNISIGSDGYITRTYTNWNVSTNLVANLTPLVGTITLISQKPDNNTQFSTTSINFNLSVLYVGNMTSTKCNLTLNNNMVYSDTFSTNGTLSSISPQVVPAGLNTYNWTCYNQFTSLTTDTYNFYSDSVVPTITTTFINKSVYFYNNISSQFNFTDDQSLFSFNISVDGITQVYSYLNGTVNNASYTLNQNPQLYSTGRHTLTVTSYDGHTAEVLTDKSYSVSTGMFGDVLNIDSKNSIKIQAKDKSYSDKWKTNKEIDRYTFDYIPKTKSKTKTFIVTTEKPLYIVNRPDLPYKSWIISGDKWIDFKIKGQDDFTISIKKINDYKAEVTVGNIKNMDKIEFESIGELNQVTKDFTFFVGNYTQTYTTPVLEGTTTSSYLTFDFGNVTFTPSVSGIVNGTTQTITNPSSNVYAMSYYIDILGYSRYIVGNWSFSVNSFNFTDGYTQQIYNIGISNNCSNTSWARAMTFTFYDEINTTNSPQIDNTFLNIHLKLWPENPLFFTQLNYSFSGESNYSICIYPNGASYNISSITQYYADGYNTRGYYIINQRITNDTVITPLYHISSTSASNIKINVYDQSNSLPIVNAYVLALRYYPEHNTYNTVEIEQTDSNGNAMFSLVPYNTFYKFIIIYNGNIYTPAKSENPQTITSTTLPLPIQTRTSITRSLQYISQVYTNVTCDPSTYICSFTWVDINNLAQTAQLNIYRVSGFGKQLIYSAETSSPSGIMYYHITENTTGKSYLAEGGIETNTRFSFYVVARDEISINKTGSFGSIYSVIYAALFLVLEVSLIFIDAGPTGLVIGSIVGLAAGAVFGIVPLTWIGIMSIATIGAIMLYFSKS